MFIRARIVRLCQSNTCQQCSYQPKLSETISDHTFITGIIRNYVSTPLVTPTLIRWGLSDHMRPKHVTVEWQWISHSIPVLISCDRHQSSSNSYALLLPKSKKSILSTCTLLLADKYISCNSILQTNMFTILDCIHGMYERCQFKMSLLGWCEFLAWDITESSYVYTIS